jgi:membrane protein YqaA with SNARE-associated domain
MSMDRKAQGILQIALSIGIVAAVLYFSKEIAALHRYGYAGAFIISMLSSATILFPAPGWAIVIAMSRMLDPLTLGIVAGIGSAIGELTGYLAGEGARDILEERVKETKRVHEFVERFGPAAIFVLAFIPNPLFDVAGFAAGGAEIEWWKFLIATAAGRILRYVLLAMAGALALGLVA